ncbi:MAG TPA: hypothetical protein VFB60_19365 [Ktedonobacteraceae bacterium]|nr:hypothetical protein [Ktedonobacteraceae bacterium]
MRTLSTHLLSRCRKALLNCDKFNSDEALKTVFLVEELIFYQDTLPQANNREDRVDKLIKFLIDKQLHNGEFVFITFLRVLCIYIHPEDKLYAEIRLLCIDIESECFLFEASQVPAETAATVMPEGVYNQPGLLTKMIKCLLQCHHMQDRELREKVLDLLPVAITQDMPKSDQSSDFRHILQLLQTCSRYPAGMDMLAYALYQKEGESPQWQAFDSLLHSIFPKTIVTYTRLQQLQFILKAATWPDKVFKRAYKMCIPDDWLIVDSKGAANLPMMLENLANAPLQNEGTFPLLAFAQYLAYYAQKQQETTTQQALSAWIDKRVKELGLGTTQIDRLRRMVKEEYSSDVYYLLVTLEPDEERSFYIRAWLLDNDYNVIQNAGIEVIDEPIALEHIPDFLDEALEKCGDYLEGEIDKLIVEFALPNELLCEPIDHWQIDTGMGRVKLGIRHKVVIRSLERARKKKMLPLWKSKWQAYLEFIDGKPASARAKGPIWICDQKHCATQESVAAALRDSSIVCLALTFVPPDYLSDPDHIFNVILSSGIPIALWPRAYIGELQSIRRLFKSFLAQKTLARIPDLVWKQRLQAGESKNGHHHGHHLTLLWDDPHRLPPTTTAMQLRMPPRRGV